MSPLIIIAVIYFIVHSIKKRNSRKKQYNRIQTVKTVPTLNQSQLIKIKQAEEKQLDRLKKEDLKLQKQAAAQAEKIRKARYQAKTAYNDIVHLKQQQTDILKLYGIHESIYNDPDRSDKQRIAAYNRMIAYDNRIRTINRQIETAQYKIDTYNRLVKS